MDWWFSLFLFIVVLLCYIHIQEQYKSSCELEVYEYDYTSREDLYNVCKWKQPVIFPLSLENCIENIMYLKIKDKIDYLEKDSIDLDFSSLEFDSGRYLIETDTNSKFYSDNNTSYIQDNNDLLKWFTNLDEQLEPTMNIKTERDIIYGSRKSNTISKYHTETSQFLYVPEQCDSINVKMCSWKYKHIMRPDLNKADWEKYSAYDLFKNKDNLEILEFSINPGYLLYIPSYWFYSIQFQGKMDKVYSVTYTNLANYIANIKTNVIKIIQTQNIIDMGNLRKVSKKVSFAKNIEECEAESEKENIEENTIVSELIDDLNPNKKCE